MKKWDTLFVYLNPDKHDSVENISEINILYKESTSKLIFVSYSSTVQLFVNSGKNWWLCLFNNTCSQIFM